jgi:mannose-6-phosphate isomerase-like protein (cupin superfamily)
MKKRIQFLLSVFITISVMGLVVAAADDGKQATFTRGKFAVPIRHEVVEADWTARDYSKPKIESYAQGWSRGEHTHPVNLIMTIVTGRMEFVFGRQRFVVEPGDEIFYAAHTVHSARNLYDGTTQMMESYKR